MIIPQARDLMDVVDSYAAAPSAYEALAFKQIADAVGSGNYTCTLTTSGKAAQDVNHIKTILGARGYSWSQTSTTITIKWDNSSPAVAISY